VHNSSDASNSDNSKTSTNTLTTNFTATMYKLRSTNYVLRKPRRTVRTDIQQRAQWAKLATLFENSL